MSQITDNDFTLRCCWMCHHCVLDIDKGYLCTANPRKPSIIGGNVEIHIDRSSCKHFDRG